MSASKPPQRFVRRLAGLKESLGGHVVVSNKAQGGGTGEQLKVDEFREMDPTCSKLRRGD